MDNIFDAMMAFVPTVSLNETTDEFDYFLSTPCESVNGDVLGWWYTRRATYPRLSRMAMDYLVIPGKSLLISCSQLELTAICSYYS